MAKKFVNKNGWWGILLHASWPTVLATVITGMVFQLAESGEAGLSAFTAGVVVWMLSAVSVLLIAAIWKNNRHLAISMALEVFVASIVVIDLLLHTLSLFYTLLT